MRHVFAFVLLLILLAAYPANAALNPDDVVVVVNNWPDVADMSHAVGEYYCDQRGISRTRIAEISVDPQYGWIPARDFVQGIMADTADPQSLVYMLKHRQGFDTENLSDPTNDPTKVIVLCYGVPLKLARWEVWSSVDSALTLLFNENPWGERPMGDWTVKHALGWDDNLLGSICIMNPFRGTAALPGDRPDIGEYDKRLFDFGDFRASPYNATVETAPFFTKVRMLSADTAIAVGKRGMIFRGVRVGGNWDWTFIADEGKQFIRGNITDVSVVDANTAVVCSDTGMAIAVKVPDDENPATVLRTGTPGYNEWANYDDITGVSFYGSSAGYAVGRLADGSFAVVHCTGQSSGTPIWKSTNVGSGTPAQDFYPHGVAAVDSTHIWVTGRDGIWLYNGATWAHQYTSASKTWDICGKKVGESYVAWAVEGDGSILKYDGSSWSVVSGVSVPAMSAQVADLSAFDSDHVTVAWGSNTYLRYDEGDWSTITSNAAVASATWTGAGSTFAVSGLDSTLRCATPSAGACSWAAAVSVPDCTWKMRYMVCRLDGYSAPTVTVTGYGTMPKDVKEMIDRSVRASYGSSATAGLNFVLDGNGSWQPSEWKGTWVNPGGYPSSWELSIPLAKRLDDMVGYEHVWKDGSGRYLDAEASHSGEVIGYTSRGSYVVTAHTQTAWWRPPNIEWADGAIGLFSGVSADAYTLTKPLFIHSLKADSRVEPAKLKVYLHDVGADTGNFYRTHWIGLHRANGTLIANSTAMFDSSIRIENTPTAVLDLSAIDWGSDHNSYLAVHFPADDPWHKDDSLLYAGGIAGQQPREYTNPNPTVWNASTSGLTYEAVLYQSLDAELIRMGCSGSAGNAWEPLGMFCPVPEVMFPLYAGGCSWAESAHAGLPGLGWMEVVIGDPLMRPFAMHELQPSLIDPAPGEDMHVRGPVTLPVHDANGSMTKAAFWNLVGGKRMWLGEDDSAPYELVLDTLATSNSVRLYPDETTVGIKAVAYQTGTVLGRAEAPTRSFVVDSALPSVSITAPEQDDAVLVTPQTFSAEVTGGTPAHVEFWRFGISGPTLIADVNTQPYQCSITSDVAEGVYDLQAVAYGANGSYASYSARRRTLVLHDPPVSSMAGLATTDDDTEVLLANVPVVAGTSSFGNAFYIEDPNRATGIRVETAQTVPVGAKATVRGVLHTAGAELTERYIEATEVWTMGTMAVAPVLMSTRDLGGDPPGDAEANPPTKNPGVTGAVGTYNTGLLTTIAGWATYSAYDPLTKEYLSYVDDGSGLQDGNLLPWVWTPVQVNASEPVPVTGVCVNPRNVPWPLSGAYVSVTGISSTMRSGDNIVRCLIPRSGEDIYSLNTLYTPCYYFPEMCFYPVGYMSESEGIVPIPPGGGVRLDNAVVQENTGATLVVLDANPAGWPSIVNATTYFSQGQTITVLGTVVSGSAGDELNADMIYCAEAPGGQEMLMAPGESGMQSYWPAENEAGPIGCALSQSDGASVSLTAVQVARVVDGYFGVREMTEVLEGDPRLLVSRSCQVLPCWSVDVQGTITTLASGQRAIVPASVWLYTDAQGRPAPPYVWMMGSSWPHKQQIQ